MDDLSVSESIDTIKRDDEDKLKRMHINKILLEKAQLYRLIMNVDGKKSFINGLEDAFELIYGDSGIIDKEPL